MNHFANSLFTLFFGWSRTIIQQVWSSSASGHFSGFFTWLGDHWFLLVAGLALLGTVIDLLVWLLRWQQYLVWKTRIRKTRIKRRKTWIKRRKTRIRKTRIKR